MSYNIPAHCAKKPVNITNNHPRSYNLNINSYTFNEILGLFDLTSNISIEDLKRAKQKVLKTHPDKSKLPPDYFIFYKKAFELVVNYYQTQTVEKTTQPVPQKPMEYEPIYHTDKRTTNQIKKNVETTNNFQSEFNRLYETHMQQKPDTTKHQWFTQDTPALQYNGKVSAGNMSSAFETLKQQQQQMAMMKYNGVKEMNSGGNMVASNFYDDVEPDEQDDVYVSSDPFSKLKFEDLRKVHKDQTIFNVGESDFNSVPQYKSVDQYAQQRSSQSFNVMEKQQAEMLLAQQEMQHKERMMRKHQESMMRIMENEEKNKLIRSRFLQLENRGNNL
jgi:hypothetical protein